MLEGSEHSTQCINAQGRSFFDFKTKEPLLSLGLNSCLKPVSSFELTKDFEKYLDHVSILNPALPPAVGPAPNDHLQAMASSLTPTASPAAYTEPTSTPEPPPTPPPTPPPSPSTSQASVLACETPLDGLDMDFFIPLISLKTLLPNSKLKNLPDRIEISKLLDFESDNLQDTGKPAMEPRKLLFDEAKHDDFDFVIDPSSVELEKKLPLDSTHSSSVKVSKSGVLSKMYGNKMPYTQNIESFFGDAYPSKIRIPALDSMEWSLLAADKVGEFFEETKPKANTTELNADHFFNAKKTFNWPKSLGYSTSICDQHMFSRPPTQKMNSLCAFKSKRKAFSTSLLAQVPRDIHAAGDGVKLIKKTKERIKDLFQDNLETTCRLANKSNRRRAKAPPNKLGDPIGIVKTGVRIFSKPAKLFAFDKERLWKKKGEGLMEIWRQSETHNCHMLLWDKNSGELLVHMHVDGKWKVNFLAGSTNSCRWVYENYANCPEGVQQPLSCRFEHSDMADEFVDIVANCSQKPSSS